MDVPKKVQVRWLLRPDDASRLGFAEHKRGGTKRVFLCLAPQQCILLVSILELAIASKWCVEVGQLVYRKLVLDFSVNCFSLFATTTIVGQFEFYLKSNFAILEV